MLSTPQNSMHFKSAQCAVSGIGVSSNEERKQLTVLADPLDEGELEIPIMNPEDELTDELGEGTSSSSSLFSDGDLVNSAAATKFTQIRDISQTIVPN